MVTERPSPASISGGRLDNRREVGDDRESWVVGGDAATGPCRPLRRTAVTPTVPASHPPDQAVCCRRCNLPQAIPSIESSSVFRNAVTTPALREAKSCPHIGHRYDIVPIRASLSNDCRYRRQQSRSLPASSRLR